MAYFSTYFASYFDAGPPPESEAGPHWQAAHWPAEFWGAGHWPVAGAAPEFSGSIAGALVGASAEFIGTVENPAEPDQEGGQGGGSGGERDDALPLRGGSILSDADYRRTPAQLVDDALARIRRPDRINADGTVTTYAQRVAPAAFATVDTETDADDEAAAVLAGYLAMDD